MCVCVCLSEPVCAVGQGVSALCCATEGQKWIFSGYSLTGVRNKWAISMNLFSDCINSFFISFFFLKALCVWVGALHRFCQPSSDCRRLCERQWRILHRWVCGILFTSVLVTVLVSRWCQIPKKKMFQYTDVAVCCSQSRGCTACGPGPPPSDRSKCSVYHSCSQQLDPAV